MALDRCFEEATIRNSSFGEENSLLSQWKSTSNPKTDSSGGFDCSICLENVQDPVVTLCGHLFCWPCICKWLHSQNTSSETTNQEQQCPVCKSPVSLTALVPLYGKGQKWNPDKDESQNQGIPIPHRPLGPTYDVFNSSTVINGSHDRYYQSRMGDYGASIAIPSSTIENVLNPITGVFGEMVYARAFGNTITNIYVYPNSYNLLGSSSPRIRRHIMKADKSLNRICIFFFCCLILCLLLF